VGLGLVRPLAEVYAACHAAAAKGQGGDAAAAWAAFEMRTTMLQTLARGLAEGGAQNAAAAKAPAAQQAEPTQKAPLPIRRSPAAGKGAAPAAPPKTGGDPANPMGFFAKKKPEAEAPERPEVPADTDSPPVEQPPAAPPPPAQDAPEADTPKGAQDADAPPSNPMSFFKKKKSDDDGA